MVLTARVSRMRVLATLLAGFAVGNALAQTDWRRPGSQKDAICQGSCGGGCGPCGGRTGGDTSRQDSAEDQEEERLRLQRNARYRAIHVQAYAAWDKGDYREALRLLREQQTIRDGPNVKGDIAALEKYLAEKTARDEARTSAYAAIQEASYAHKRGDLRAALVLYRRAMAIDPDSLADEGKKWVRDFELRLISASSMQQTIDTYAQTLSATQSTGGLDFDATLTPTRPSSASQNGNPMVVVALNVPSGLVKPLENAIAVAYQNAPPGVSDRVRKGFQAVMDRDWKVAKAWFEDALNRDPGNVDLKRLVGLVSPAPEKRQATNPRQDSVPARHSFASLSANADKMSTAQVMTALENIMIQNISEETFGKVK